MFWKLRATFSVLVDILPFGSGSMAPRFEKKYKGIELLSQTQIFWSQYLCNLKVQTFDISNLDYFIYISINYSINSLKYLRSTTLGYKDIEIKKSEFVAKTQLIWKIWSFNRKLLFIFCQWCINGTLNNKYVAEHFFWT